MDKMDVLEASTVTEEIDMEDLVTEDHSSPEDSLVNLTKAPNTKCSRVSGRPVNKDKSRCFKCKEFGHFQG